MRHITEDGLRLIKEHEGLMLRAYPDPASGAEPWTIGYGHTKGVRPDDTVTEAEAEALLREDVEWAERCVERALTSDVSDNQFDALVSLAFNIGCANFQKSTVLRLANEDCDNDDLVRHAFKLWNKAKGHELAGLTKRRLDEAQHFLT